ncbi:Protein LURP-one-related 8 [Dichanthelium oligosanthes]|uniref:Protein LURP-one-related 8 n=1 Tax=Dichanthelium oligosanthes TaxID=888268 RepID=A0A1E5WFA7_9POAL|nr:Protein LURP-one-related 8 [Dichanthelium oligosanthes]
MTAKVHPNVAVPSPLGHPAAAAPADEEPVTLTVWRKSLLFNCRGFTVFDASGNLVYRVDTYASDSRAEVVLMDAAGRAVLTVRRRKVIGLGADQWLVYHGEETRLPPLYTVKRAAQCMRGGGAKSMAHVAPCSGAAAAGGRGSKAAGGGYEVEGSYLRRCCTVYDERRRAVAEVRPKEAVGSDVFRLVVQPGTEVSLAMAVVLALDQMFGKPSLLRSWSS